MNDEFRQLEDDHEAGLYWLYPNSRLVSCWTGDWAGRGMHWIYPISRLLSCWTGDWAGLGRGLYWLLCALHRVIFVTGTTISQQVIEDVMSMRVLEVDRNALRHTRDYLVLRDFEHLLDRPSTGWTTLKHFLDHLEKF